MNTPAPFTERLVQSAVPCKRLNGAHWLFSCCSNFPIPSLLPLFLILFFCPEWEISPNITCGPVNIPCGNSATPLDQPHDLSQKSENFVNASKCRTWRHTWKSGHLAIPEETVYTLKIGTFHCVFESLAPESAPVTCLPSSRWLFCGLSVTVSLLFCKEKTNLWKNSKSKNSKKNKVCHGPLNSRNQNPGLKTSF